MSLGSGGQACCNICKDCGQYKKIVNFEKSDLFCRQLTTKTNILTKNNTSFINDEINDLNNLITYNCENIGISSQEEYTSIEHYEIKCLRCRKMLEQAHKYQMFRDKDHAIEICDHCQKSRKIHAECKKNVTELFTNISKETKSNTVFTQKFHDAPDMVANTTREKKLDERLKHTLGSNLYQYTIPNDNYEQKIQHAVHNKKYQEVSDNFSSPLEEKSKRVALSQNSKLARSIIKKHKKDVLKSKYHIETNIDLENEESLQDMSSYSFIVPQDSSYYRDMQSEPETYLDRQNKNRKTVLNSPRNVNENAWKSKIQDNDNYIRRYHSEELLPQSLMSTVDGFIGEDFSYLFPRERDAVILKKVTSSSELIKDTIDRFRKEKEDEQRKQLEERDKKEQKRKTEEVTKKKDHIMENQEIKEKQSETKDNNDMEIMTDDDKKELNEKELEALSHKKKEGPKNKKTGDKSTLENRGHREEDIRKESKLKKDHIETVQLKDHLVTTKKAGLKLEDKKEPDNKDNLETRLGKKENMKYKGMSKKEKNVGDEASKKIKELLSLQAKEKEEISKMNKKHQDEEKKAKELLEKKIKEKPNKKMRNESDTVDGLRPDTGEVKKRISHSKPMANELEKTEKPVNELKLKNVKVRKSSDDLILQLVKVKQTVKSFSGKKVLKSLPHINLSAYLIRPQKQRLVSSHDLQRPSDLELDVESLLNKNKTENVLDMVVGQKILKSTHPTIEKTKKEEDDKVNIQFEEDPVLENSYQIKQEVHVDVKQESVAKSGKFLVEQEIPKGIIKYALSDRSFIEKGWTMLPTEKVVRKMNVYRMRPTHPEFDWFARNKNRRYMQYDSGERLAEFDDNGRGRWYYKNGRLALDYYDAEEINAQQRFVIYSSGEPDEYGKTHPVTVLASFDYLGNGIVFDHTGKIRLKYNQTEGIVLDRSIGPVSHWKWHTLNDPPILQQVMIDTQMPHKDMKILKIGDKKDTKLTVENEEMLAIEFHNFVKEKSKKLTQKFKPFQIKMKALKINENFSLRILDQATIYLIFRDGSTNLKLNIGMILDHKEIVDTESAEVGEVVSSLERLPARTDSLAGLQHCVVNAQRFAKQRTERERRIRPTKPISSVDKLIASASKSLRSPFQVVPSNSSFTAGGCQCYRKKSACNL